MKRSLFIWTFRLLRATALAVLVFILVLWCGQRFVYFRPTKMTETPAGERVSLARRFPRGMPIVETDFRSADGTRLTGAVFLSGDTVDENTIPVLFCHGNGGWMGHETEWVFFPYAPGPAEYAFFLFDYRAYGYSDGSVWGLDEWKFYADARAARTWLAEYVKKPETEVVLMGHSLGGAVAVDLAQDGTPGLVLCSTFDSLPDVAQRHLQYFPVKWLVADGFRSAEKIVTVSAPVLMFHGTRDRTVPIACGERLFEAAREPKNFVEMGCGHDDIPVSEVRKAMKEFLKR